MNDHDANACTQPITKGLSLAAAAMVALGLPPAVNAQWTQWGGPNQDFVAHVTGLAPTWPDEGPKRLWSHELGEGYSAILADAGKLYTMYRADDKEIVTCLDATTGETVWEYRYDASPREGHIKQFGEGPRSTPLLDGDRLYTIGVSAKMHCLDRDTGKVIWSHDLWDEFEGNVLNHGYASSPIAYKDTVIALVGGEGQSIVAFSKADGTVAWKALSFRNSYSTPKILDIDGETQLVTFMAKEVIGVDPDNGELKWRFPHENQWEQNVCMPVMTDDNHLFISSAEAGSKGLKLTRNGDQTSVEELWSTRKIRFYHVTSVRVGDYVYGSSGEQSPAFMAAVNIKTGDIAWRKRGFGKATCLYADGRFIILDEDGQLALVTATPTSFKVNAKAPVLNKTAWTVPTLVGKTLFVRDQKNIMALDLG